MAATNKTLYLAEDDASVWDRARELADDKLRPVVMVALRRFVADQEAQIKMIDRIEIRYRDTANDRRPTAKAFYGRWLITREDPYCPIATIQSVIKNSLGVAEAQNLQDLAGQSTNRYRSDLLTGPPKLLPLANARYHPAPAIEGWVEYKSYAVAVSAKGSVVLFTFEGNPELPDGVLQTYTNFDSAISDHHGDAKVALHTALQRQGVPVEELDI